MTQLAVVYRKTSDLIPYAMNSRTHDAQQVAQIAASIKEFGFNNPIAIDGENGVIAGHGRLLAAQKLGLNEVPTIELSHLTEQQKKAYVIADNKIAINAGWDAEILKFEIQDLDPAMLALTGFSDKEIANMMGIDDGAEVAEPVDESRNLIMVELTSERECETLFTELQERGFDCKIMS